MDPSVYKDIVRQEDKHWWFAARRAIVGTVFSRIKLPANANILDAGCGGGGNLPFLNRFGRVHAFEMHEDSCKFAANRAVGEVELGHLPDAIPFGDKSFDLITLFDVLEHVKDDEASLAALTRRLKPGGVLFINVPAYQFLFGQVDILHHHHRRYSKQELLSKVKAAGLKVELMSYWNFFLFPVALAVRLFEKIRPPRGLAVGMKTPEEPVNHALGTLVGAERFLVPYGIIPFGLSLLVIARKPA